MIKKLVLLFLILFASVGCAQAGVTYGGVDDRSIYITQPTAVNNLPSLYADLVGTYGESETQNNILNEVSPGVWRCSKLTIPENVPFYINSSTATEVRLMSNYRDWAIEGYPILDNTKIVGWDRTNDTQKGFLNTAQLVIYTPIHDVEMESFREIYCGYSVEHGVSHQDYYNITVRKCRVGLSFYGDNLTVNNITIRDNSPQNGNGIYSTLVDDSIFSNISCINVSDPANGPLGYDNAYAIYFVGSNNILRDVYVLNASWSAVNIGGYDNGCENITCENMTVIGSGHNVFEVELNNSTFRNITLSNGYNHGFFEVGRYETGKIIGGNVYENVHVSNVGSYGMYFDEGSHNSIVRNSTFSGNGIYCLNSRNETIINCTQSGAPQLGAVFSKISEYGDGYFYCDNHTLIDSSFSNNFQYDIWSELGTNISVINNEYTSIAAASGQDITVYYYPNIIVENLTGIPVSNAVITINTTAKNGNGAIQSEFITDESGKLYNAGNRSNWLSVPDFKLIGSTSTSYITTVTATKSGQTDSEIINPDNTWYSENIQSLSSPETVLVLDVAGEEEYFPIANFSASVTSGTYPLSVSFTDTSAGNPTSWAWDLDGNGVVDKTTQNVIKYNYKTAGNYTVNLTVSNEDGTDSEVKTAYIHVTKPTGLTVKIYNMFSWLFQYFAGVRLLD